METDKYLCMLLVFLRERKTITERGNENEKNKYGQRDIFLCQRKNLEQQNEKEKMLVIHILPGGAGEILPSSFIHIGNYSGQYVKTEYLHRGAVDNLAEYTLCHWGH